MNRWRKSTSQSEFLRKQMHTCANLLLHVCYFAFSNFLVKLYAFLFCRNFAKGIVPSAIMLLINEFIKLLFNHWTVGGRQHPRSEFHMPTMPLHSNIWFYSYVTFFRCHMYTYFHVQPNCASTVWHRIRIWQAKIHDRYICWWLKPFVKETSFCTTDKPVMYGKCDTALGFVDSTLHVQ